jgi:hypothetical protein
MFDPVLLQFGEVFLKITEDLLDQIDLMRPHRLPENGRNKSKRKAMNLYSEAFKINSVFRFRNLENSDPSFYPLLEHCQIKLVLFTQMFQEIYKFLFYCFKTWMCF